MINLSEKDLNRIFTEAYREKPEELLEFSLLLSGKCKIGNYIFPAPSLGTYILLSEWKSPFVSDEKTIGADVPENQERFITLEEFYTTLFLLKNGEKSADILMEKRMEQFFSKKRNKSGKIKVPGNILKKFMKQYPFADEAKGVEELQKILSLHSAEDMLPDSFEGGNMPWKTPRPWEENNYCVWMESITGLTFFVQEMLPAFSLRDILWKLPYAALGFLLIREARKNNIKGIGKEETSRRLWKMFSKTMENKKFFDGKISQNRKEKNEK